ncbi:MAG TPA: Xaa-Pro peptidase family protein [Stellaceae bacterium]|nr:Xaa-Pro peptidase family protein [Stellaceae bacterium]
MSASDKPELHRHFSEREFARRKSAALATLERERLDGLLIFRQETMYWLTGYDTFGFVFFQCLVLDGDGRTTLLTRLPDLRVAQLTSDIPDIRFWKDGEHADPASDLKSLLAEMGMQGKRLGIEWEAYGLTARNGRRVEAVLAGFCTLVDASFLVSKLRLVKSEEELACVRRAGELADMALAECYRLAVPGAWEGDILAAMEGVMLRHDGDPPANENVIGSGRRSFMGRYISGRSRLEPSDALLVEFAGVYRHYHAALMRVLRVGKPIPMQVELHDIGVEALRAAQAACRIGRPIGDLYRAFAATVAKSGYKFGNDRGLSYSMGYSLGATFAPNWMDYPLLHGDNSTLVEANMVFFMHIGLRDDARGFAVAPGETIIVREDGVERLSKDSLAFRINP